LSIPVIVTKRESDNSVDETSAKVSPRYVRILTVLLGLAIVILRSRHSFLAPEFWAEDGVFFQDAYNMGLDSLITPLAGTLHLYGYLVAMLAANLPLIAAPWIEAYGNLAAFAITMWLATSPRFQAPYRPLMALAIACAPAAFEIIGFLANSDWVLSIGVFVLLFCEPSRNKLILYAEMFFVLIAGLSGPTALYLVPLFLWQSYTAQGEARHRILMLTATLCAASAIQLFFLVEGASPAFNLVAPAPYSKLLWLSMPVRWLDAIWPLGKNRIGFGMIAIGTVFVAAVLAISFSLRPPRRVFKLAMLYFAGIILFTGMLKYRSDLGTVSVNCGRYFFAGSVFFFWFLCLAADELPGYRNLLLIMCTAFMLNVAVSYRSIRPPAPAPYASFLSREGDITIPIAPTGWQITINRH
jgi:hypothetical protein